MNSPPRAMAMTTSGTNPLAATCSANSRPATPNASQPSTSRSSVTGVTLQVCVGKLITPNRCVAAAVLFGYRGEQLAPTLNETLETKGFAMSFYRALRRPAVVVTAFAAAVSATVLPLGSPASAAAGAFSFTKIEGAAGD